MSSIRNAVKRKTHKERAQPSSRAKFGLLEKHKDYVLRARDFNSKKKRLQALQEKAAFRNPDEFYFKMQNMATKGGVHTNVPGESLDADTLYLLKTQDLNYIGMKKRVDERKIERLESALHNVSALEEIGRVNKHTIFFDSEDDEDMQNFDAAKHFDTHPDLVGRSVNRPRLEQLESDQAQFEPQGGGSKKVKKLRDVQYRELLERKKRIEKLSKAGDALQMQRNVMGKGRKYKVKGTGQDGKPKQFVWRQERKR